MYRGPQGSLDVLLRQIAIVEAEDFVRRYLMRIDQERVEHLVEEINHIRLSLFIRRPRMRLGHF